MVKPRGPRRSAASPGLSLILGLAGLGVAAYLAVQIGRVVLPSVPLVVGLVLSADVAAYVLTRLGGRPAAGLPFTGRLARLLLGAGRLVFTSAAALSGWRPVHAQSVDQLLAYTPSDFEAWTGQLLRRQGYRDVRVTGRRGDLGIDLLAVDPRGRTVGIQCKRYAAKSRVSSRDMQLFYGMLVHHRLEHGVYVTTSTFTHAARALASEHDIDLYDRERLARIL